MYVQLKILFFRFLNLFQNRSIEWYKAELEKIKKLYLELQTELDRLDRLRKNWTYFSLKREEFMKTVAIQQPEEDVECDCDVFIDKPVVRSPLYRC